MIWVETPTNPMMKYYRYKKFPYWQKKNIKALLAVDNTFANSILTTSFGFGSRHVMHSATKILGGHTMCPELFGLEG